MGAHIVIVGAGLAGITLALSLPNTVSVTLLSHSPAPCGASPRALGGLAAALGPEDSLEQHVEDTLVAGAHHGDPQVVRHILQAGPNAVQWLLDRNVPFDRGTDGALHLTREGGHGQRRIAHVADASGQAIMQALQAELASAVHIGMRRYCQVTALRQDEQGQVAGVDIYDRRLGTHETLHADSVVLASGGLGRLYSHSTNPAEALGDGIALAWRVGAHIQDLEFIQFHPTCLRTAGATFLLTEALRGEGGYLRDAQGRRFMPYYDSRAELAPRDIVSRAIAEQMRRDQRNHVWLDVRHLGERTLERHFPQAVQEGRARGLDLSRDLVPVAPAAHYSCGGVKTDLHGRSTVPGLYAVGEVACTGLHGANRLASNSLLECVVMAQAAARAIARSDPGAPKPLLAGLRQHHQDSGSLPSLPALQALMQEHVGLHRHRSGLQQALQTLEQWREQFKRGTLSPDRRAMALRVDTAWLIAQAALTRAHSLGAHFRSD